MTGPEHRQEGERLIGAVTIPGAMNPGHRVLAPGDHAAPSSWRRPTSWPRRLTRPSGTPAPQKTHRRPRARATERREMRP